MALARDDSGIRLDSNGEYQGKTPSDWIDALREQEQRIDRMKDAVNLELSFWRAYRMEGNRQEIPIHRDVHKSWKERCRMSA